MSTIRAAVLVPIFERQDDISVVLTRRTEHLPSHQGQVAFPGGRFDPTRDETLLATALREAEEEIGLAPHDVELLGSLRDVETMSSGFVISSFVGRVRPDYRYRPCAAEVARVFHMPLRAYRDAGLRTTVEWQYQGNTFRVPAIRFEDDIVWGATLRILDLLVASPLVPHPAGN
jgi:8-oxo-dGTP pyrophosphatase MutT (NUDIX family)